MITQNSTLNNQNCHVMLRVLSGFIIGVKSLFHPLRDHELYRDKFFWHLPDPEDEEGKDLTFTDITARA